MEGVTNDKDLSQGNFSDTPHSDGTGVLTRNTNNCWGGGGGRGEKKRRKKKQIPEEPKRTQNQ